MKSSVMANAERAAGKRRVGFRVGRRAGLDRTARGVEVGSLTDTCRIRYYDLKRNWRKVEPHLGNDFLNRVLVTEFDKFTYGRWGQRFKRGMLPCEFESCDWAEGHRGRVPRFWKYVKHAACHWLVNFTLVLAQLVYPNREWRIITSDQHSTVWDGKTTVFDFNFQAMWISPHECFRLATTGENAKELRPGQFLETFLAEHWRIEPASPNTLVSKVSGLLTDAARL